MKKGLLLMLAAALLATLVLAACDQKNTASSGSEPQVAGGWSVGETLDVTQEAKAAYDKAMEGLVGVNYEPLALLGSQVVAGRNYCVLCRAQVVVPDAIPYLALVYVYENPQGQAEVSNIVRLDVAGLNKDDATMLDAVMKEDPQRLSGGWSVKEDAALDQDLKAVFDKATEALAGMAFTPCADLATQVVAGTNHCFLCLGKATVPDAKPEADLVFVYQDLQGGAEILRSVKLDAGALWDYGVE